MHQKAFIINQLWAGIFASLLVSAILGGVAYAWQDNAEKSELRTKLEAIEGAQLPDRMVRIETKIESTNDSVRRIEAQQIKIDDKIDKIVEKLGAQ